MKVLFITSLDFGEISLATTFARNGPFKAVFAVPETRIAYFDEPVDKLYPFVSITDLRAIVATEQPDLVSFNTAYLFVDGGMATMEQFEAFLDWLEEGGYPVMTTDPFVRVFDRHPGCTFRLCGEPLKDVQEQVGLLSERLRAVPHIYGFPSPGHFDGARPFFNDRFCIKGDDTLQPGKKNWLFVLASLDSMLLYGRYEKNFLRELGARISEVCGNPDNHVRCVFPANIAAALREPLSWFNNLEILDFVTLTRFESLIRSSDIVFYWNVFSNSILLCYYYDIPFLCFGKGHLADLSEELYQHMSEGIYPGGEPQFVDFLEPLDPDLDTVLRAHYSREMRQRILAEYLRLPSPASIIESITNTSAREQHCIG